MKQANAAAGVPSCPNLPASPLAICGAGESYVLCGKRPGHVDDGDNLHHDINLSIEWPTGQSPLRRI